MIGTPLITAVGQFRWRCEIAFTARNGVCKAQKCINQTEAQKMLTLEEIRDGLRDRQPGKVAAAVGVHPTTISAIRDGRRAPRYEVAKALSDYLRGE